MWYGDPHRETWEILMHPLEGLRAKTKGVCVCVMMMCERLMMCVYDVDVYDDDVCEVDVCGR